jgi:hypothetical protein
VSFNLGTIKPKKPVRREFARMLSEEGGTGIKLTNSSSYIFLCVTVFAVSDNSSLEGRLAGTFSFGLT